MRGYSLEEILGDDELLDEYERVVPGSADKFQEMAEREVEHREWVDKQHGKLVRRERLFNRILGVTAVCAIVVSVLKLFGVF